MPNEAVHLLLEAALIAGRCGLFLLAQGWADALQHPEKEVGAKDGMGSLLFKNRLEFVISHDNRMTYKNGEFYINGCKLLDNLAPKPFFKWKSWRYWFSMLSLSILDTVFPTLLFLTYFFFPFSFLLITCSFPTFSFSPSFLPFLLSFFFLRDHS